MPPPPPPPKKVHFCDDHKNIQFYHTPKHIHISETPQEYWNSKFWTPKNGASLRIHESTPPPPHPTLGLLYVCTGRYFLSFNERLIDCSGASDIFRAHVAPVNVYLRYIRCARAVDGPRVRNTRFLLLGPSIYCLRKKKNRKRPKHIWNFTMPHIIGWRQLPAISYEMKALFHYARW